MTPAPLDCVVIGAGVVGLAVARALARSGREVVVLEREARIGLHASSRNSEVIHAGLYYADDTLKARLCVSGREMLYAYCRDHAVPAQRIGKLIVAVEEQECGRLQAICEQGRRNGVDDLRQLDGGQVRTMEPALRCVAALYSPSSGIVDSHALMLALQGDIQSAGGLVVCNSEVSRIVRDPRGFVLGLADDGVEYRCRLLVNSAGSDAPRLAGMLGTSGSYRQFLAKGQYFAYQARAPFGHLVYPLPIDGGLGIHATNDLAGRTRFGPDVEWVDAPDYSVSSRRKDDFVAAISRYFPGLVADKLVPAYAGVRSKSAGPGEGLADFEILGDRQHGVPGLVNLLGIDSPGLTASLAIGDYVRTLLRV